MGALGVGAPLYFLPVPPLFSVRGLFTFCLITHLASTKRLCGRNHVGTHNMCTFVSLMLAPPIVKHLSMPL